MQKKLSDTKTIRAEELAKDQREISISSFFEKNRHLLGFDNPIRALLTTVKELVDNAADASEEMHVLPEINVTIEQLAETRFRITVEDNGPGIVKEQIPKIFAKLLYGSKFFKLKMARGQQGIGVSASVLYAQLTTGKPTKIVSKIDPKKPAHYYELHIDTQKNEPEIVKEEIIEWEKDHGTKVELELEAKYQKGKQGVFEYLKQTAIANPHILITYKGPEEEKVEFPRATNLLPIEPKQIKPHPLGVELGILIRMLKGTNARTLQSFLQTEFCRVGATKAKEVCEEAKLQPNSRPKRIARQEAENLFQAIQKIKFVAPPTDCLSPISASLLEKGLKKEIDAEFYVSVTRPPAVYRGFPFQIECCTGDTKICLEDGSIIPIKEYVENKMLNKRIFSMDNKLKIVPSKVLRVHKFKNKHKILKITTKTGRTLKLTSNNEIPILENGNIKWKKAEDSMAGEFVAVPRIFNVYGKIPHILDLLDPDEVRIVDRTLVVSLMDELREKYGNYKISAQKLGIKYENFKAYKRIKKSINRPTLSILKKIVNDLGLNLNEIKREISYIRIVDNKFTNPVMVKLPEINEDFLYVLGLLNSDGYISHREIMFVNVDEHLHNLFKEKINNLFGLKVKRYKKEVSSISNKTLFFILKKIEEILPTLPDNLITSWIKGFVDGDGWISLKEGKISSIGIATAKKEKAEFMQTLLLRLGITSKIIKRKIPNTFGRIKKRVIRTKKVQYNIIISSFENIKKFHSLISFRQTKRANILSQGIKNQIIVRSSRDVVPLGEILHEFRQENNLFQYELGFSDQTIRQAEKNNQFMTRLNLQQLVDSGQFLGAKIKQLKLLAFSDILWDKIADIELMPNEEYVYDLSVETGNFVANNIVMHNCSLAYGGNLDKEGPARLMRFANRVPLLYQQSAGAISKSVGATNWKAYNLQQSGRNLPTGPLVIAVHIASVWVPFTSESKEAIAHYPEIIKEIRLAVQECGRQLGKYLRKRYSAKEEERKKSYIEKYIPHVGQALQEILNLSEQNEKKTEKMLKEILERSRK